MFRGTIPTPVRQMLVGAVREWTCEEVYVGCSGNFTVERVLAELERFQLHGNDVSLYSSVIGAYYAGRPMTVKLKAAYKGVFGWIEDGLEDPTDTVASVMLATRLGDCIGAGGDVKDNEYYTRLRDAYRKQWPELHTATVEKLHTLEMSLVSYCCEDVATWIKDVPTDQAIITYPPFFGAAKAYERDFHKLDLLFEWDKPVYEPLDDAGLAEFFHTVTNRPFWVFGTNQELPEYEAHLFGVSRTTNRGVPIYLYASNGPMRIVGPEQVLEPVPGPRLTVGMNLGESMSLAPLSYGQFQTLRSQYLNRNKRPGSASDACAVLVDGVLIGCFAWSRAPGFGGVDNTWLYMLSDFPVAPTDYPRLSKLVLYAALSKESKLLAERLKRSRVRVAYTTAFSNRPSSMKYRGLFQVHSRKELDLTKEKWAADIDPERNPYYGQKFQINYRAPMGQWTLEEGYKEWRKKHANG